MATLQVTPTEVLVHFTTREKIGGLIGDQRIPRSAVTSVSVHDDALAAVRGLRAPGLAIPRRRLIGTWRRPRRRALVSVTAGTPALKLELTGQRYHEVVLSSADAPAWAEQLRQPA